MQSGLAAVRDAAAALTRVATWGATTGSQQRPGGGGGQHQRGDPTRQLRRRGAAPGVGADRTPPASMPRPTRWSAKARCTSSSAPGDAGQTSFTPKSARPAVDISVGPPAESLAQLRDKINAANAGVTASVLTDASGARLVLRSSTTGEANGFRIGVTDTDGNNSDGLGLSALAFDPSAGILTMAQALAAANASATPERPADQFGQQHADRRARRRDADAGQGRPRRRCRSTPSPTRRRSARRWMPSSRPTTT